MIGSAPVCDAPRRKAHDARLGQRHIDHAAGAVAVDQTFAGLERGTVDPHVHAGQECIGLVRQQIVEGHVHGIAVLDSLCLKRFLPPQTAPWTRSPSFDRPGRLVVGQDGRLGMHWPLLRRCGRPTAKARVMVSRISLSMPASIATMDDSLRPQNSARRLPCAEHRDHLSAIAPSTRPERIGPCRRRRGRTSDAYRTPATAATATLP